jgi:hypothetical protein
MDEPSVPDDRPVTKEEEEAWQEFCMVMGDFIEECEKAKQAICQAKKAA